MLLTHALGKIYTSLAVSSLPAPERTRAFHAAFQAYDELRRPRAQRQVSTARTCGEMYNLRRADTGEVCRVEDALEDLRARFEWLWLVDLHAEVKMVESRTGESLGLEE